MKAGQVSAEVDESSGQTSSTKNKGNVENIRELIHGDRRRTFHEFADAVGIRYWVCQELLAENMNMRRIAAKFLPPFLTNGQKQRRVDLS
jgi:hypothetical protein